MNSRGTEARILPDEPEGKTRTRRKRNAFNSLLSLSLSLNYSWRYEDTLLNTKRKANSGNGSTGSGNYGVY